MNWCIDGVALEHESWITRTEKRPIVLLHEGLGSVSLWKSFPRNLNQNTGHPVIAYSRQGHGKSDPLTGPRTPAFMHTEAEVLRKILSAEGLTDALIVGHSDGASIALLYASRYPTAGLVLMAPHVFVEGLTLESIRQARHSFETTDLPARLGRYHDDVRHTFFAWNDIWLHPDFERWNIEAEAAKVTAPTLIIQGRQDEYGTHAQYDSIARAAPQTDVLVLGRCGHSPHRDRPGQVLEAIKSFVSTLDTEAPAGAQPDVR